MTWQGALWGLLGFNYAVGIDILSTAYHLLCADVSSSPERNAKCEAVGHMLNYFIHLAVFAVCGGYLAGWDAERKQDVRLHLQPGSTTTFTNWGMITFSILTLLWAKFLSDTPPLRRICIRLVQKLSSQSLPGRKEP